ncbi:M23/M56 family metallopeptidase [Marinigracilibium pacificum]|nr:M23/M56 family metallopeptidase [Marinigracilibium pacificum]
MNSLFSYLLEVSCIFTMIVVGYYVFFRRLTFYKLNRLVLLLSMPVSLIIPLVSINMGFIPSTISERIYEFNDTASTYSTFISSSENLNTFDLNGIFLWVYILGVVLFLGFFIRNLVKLFQLRKRNFSQYEVSGKKVFRTDYPYVFSCFRWIFIPGNYPLDNHDPVIEHELAHIKMLHTIDILIFELFRIINWFNPFVFLFQSQLRSLHEFQADEYVLAKGVKKSEYLSRMLDAISSKTSQLSIASSFNYSTIKQRIEMITKDKSQNAQRIRYLILVPALFLLVSAFAHFVGSEPRIFPIKEGFDFKITAKFNKHVKIPSKNIDKIHGGIDIGAKEGTPIIASGSGIVAISEMKGDWGNLVVLDHGNGIITKYAHMQKLAVRKGEEVTEGDVIGYVGSTGKSTGPHLHYEVHKDGKKVNPEDYF